MNLRVSTLLKVVTLVAFCAAQFAGAADVPAGEDALLAALPEKVLPELQIALNRAMSQSSRVISSMLDLDQARVGEKQARSPMLPYASVSGSFGEAKNRYDYSAYPIKDEKTGAPVLDAEGAQKIKPEYTTSAKVQDLSYYAAISQPVYHWGALKKGYQSAQLQRAIVSRNTGEIRRALAIDVRRAYFNLISAANALESEKVALANLEQEKLFFKQQAADGFVTQATADYTDIRIKDFKLQMQRSQNNFAALWLSFCELTGNDRESPAPGFPKEVPAISTDLSPVLLGLSLQPTDYVPVNLLNAEDSIHAERLNYEIASSRLRPKFGLSVTATRGYHSPDTVVGFGGPYTLTSYGANATVNWTIFDGFSTQAAKQSSLIRMRQLERSRDQAQRYYRETLKNLVTNLRLNWESLQRTEQILRDYRGNQDIYQKDYEAGFAPKKTWEDAKAATDSMLLTANNARADFYVLLANYLSLRGKNPVVNSSSKTN